MYALFYVETTRSGQARSGSKLDDAITKETLQIIDFEMVRKFAFE
jgi:hypothetical protein